MFLLNNHVISWKSHKQAFVATLSIQAKYQALSSTTKKAIWLCTLMAELRFVQEIAIPIQQDNQSIITIANNPTNHGRTKHIDIVHHFICEIIEKNEIEFHYCLISEIITDALTKPLIRNKFEYCRELIGINSFVYDYWAGVLVYGVNIISNRPCNSNHSTWFMFRICSMQ